MWGIQYLFLTWSHCSLLPDDTIWFERNFPYSCTSEILPDIASSLQTADIPTVTAKSAVPTVKKISANSATLILNRCSNFCVEVNLTTKEYDLLELLVFNPNRVYSRDNLLRTVWGYGLDPRLDFKNIKRLCNIIVRAVLKPQYLIHIIADVHIRRLREKIEENPSDPKFVHTKWGVGYYFQSI